MEEQNNNTPPIQSPPEQQDVTATPAKSGSTGPLVGIIIIVILLIFGGLYFWDSLKGSDIELGVDITLEESLNADIAAPSDEPDKIESDLGTFDTDAFEAQLEADLKSLELEL